MEFIKINLLVLFLLFTSIHFSQTHNELQKAFSESYSLEKNEEYDKAITILLNNYSEDNYETNLRLGWLNHLAGKQKQAIQYYKICINLMPVSIEPLWGIVNPYVANDDWMNVEKTYRTMLKIDPKNSVANYKLGLIYYYRKNYTLAQKYFDVTLNLYPFDYDILLISGWTHYFLGNINKAKVLFQKTLLNKPNDASALEGLALIKL